jgi:hypothetical protein
MSPFCSYPVLPRLHFQLSQDKKQKPTLRFGDIYFSASLLSD